VQKCRRSKGRTFAVDTCFFFERNKTHFSLENKLDKVVIVGESTKVWVWGQNPQPPGAEPPAAGGKRGFGNEALDAETIFTVFPLKYAFLSILWSKFLLKNTFTMTAKSVLLRPQGLCPRARTPTCPPLLCHCCQWL